MRALSEWHRSELMYEDGFVAAVLFEDDDGQAVLVRGDGVTPLALFVPIVLGMEFAVPSAWVIL